MKRCVLVAILVLMPMAGMADTFEGVWGHKKEWCSKTDDRTPFTITATEVQGYEGRCSIAKVETLGVGNSWRWQLKCSAEGTTFDQDEIVLIDHEGTLIRYHSDGLMFRYVRCK